MTSVYKKNESKSIRDIDKINKDPEKYANDITIDKLVSVLQKMSDYYYGNDISLVDDSVYDIMFDVLKERDPKNVFLFQTGVDKISETDIELPYSMPSLDKIKLNDTALTKWFNTYEGPYLLMDKLDGISVQIYKDDKGNVDLFTKKKTNIGTSKKYMLKYLVTKQSLENLPNGTCIRGEVVISKKDFTDILEFDPDLKNERSAMAGLMNTQKIDTRIAKKAQFITYNILYPRYTLSEQIKKLKDWGFTNVWNKKYKKEDFENDDFTDETLSSIELTLQNVLGERISQSEFLVDGIVIYDNSKIYEHDDGNPKHSVAFKMNSTTNMKEALVKEVIWEPSMYGDLRPVIRIEPIILSGNVTVTFVTAHNAKYIQDNKIGKGSIIKIVRSGDVIPYIVEVVKPSKKPDMPDIEYKWNETDVHIVVVNPNEEIKRKITIKQNLHFFKTTNIKFLSEGLIAKLYDAGYKDIISIITCANKKDTDLYDINGLGEKMVTKIYGQIDKAFNKIKLPELMAGSLKFGTGLGTRKLKEIIKVYPNILTMKNSKNLKEKIINISGFSNILATKFTDNIKEFCKFHDELQKKCSYNLSFDDKKTKDKKSKDKKSKDKIMINQKVVLTGFRSDKINEFIESNGGQITNSVSKNTTLVIYVPSDKGSSKLDKAKELDITIMKRSEFEKKYNIIDF